MTYRVDRHQPQNVYRDDQYIGVMFTPEDAQLVVEALNGGQRGSNEGWANAKPYRIYSRWVNASDHTNRSVYDAIRDAYAAGLASTTEDDNALGSLPADSCTGCTTAKGDPGCPVHQGRKPRGPKPPPLGPGCICDGSGRTCPRHGAVI